MVIVCDYCHKEADSVIRDNPPAYSHCGKFAFHKKCLDRVKDQEKALQEIETLTNNLVNWKKKNPNWKFQY